MSERSERIYPVPKALLAIGPPMANGVMWLLAGSPTARTLVELNLAAGGPAATFPVSSAAATVAESPDGTLAIGTATATAGAVEIRSGSSGSLTATVPVGGPVVKAAFGSVDGLLFILDRQAGDAVVTVLSPPKIEHQFDVAPETISIAPSPDGDLWAIQTDGTVDDWSVPGGQLQARFKLPGPGVDLAISPDGLTLYVLEGTAAVDNVAVVSGATEQVLKVLPAPADCRALSLSPDGRILYEAVGTDDYGNIQASPVSD